MSPCARIVPPRAKETFSKALTRTSQSELVRALNSRFTESDCFRKAWSTEGVNHC